MKSSLYTIGISTAAAALLVAGLVGGYEASAQQEQVSEELSAKTGEQLTETMAAEGPFATPLPDHLFLPAEEGAESVVFVHFDKPLPEATRVIYTGFGIKGRWCAEDQQKIEEEAGKGFTHFHRVAEVASAEAGHGGAEPGEEGYWLKHIAVGPAFEMPWGQVEPGKVDENFMPTEAPRCES